MNRFKITLGFLFFASLVYCDPKPVASTPTSKSLFLGLDQISYLTGNYNAKTVLVSLADEESDKEHFLRPEVKLAFQRMVDDFEREKPATYKQHIFLVSSFRSFSQQKGIWESKFTGKKAMRVPVKGKSESEIVDLILEFSSAPGTSRHHWGTDFDINTLENKYFESGGKGKVLYDWLVANANKYGFCQPYNDRKIRGGKGYQEEKWHWSYAPIANQLEMEWSKSFHLQKIQLDGSFLGAGTLGSRSLEFVTSINADCAKITKPTF